MVELSSLAKTCGGMRSSTHNTVILGIFVQKIVFVGGGLHNKFYYQS